MSAIAEVSNDARTTIELSEPYSVCIRVKGTAPFLFHRWSVDGVEAKAKAAKGSKAKKEDDLESYVYRTPEKLLAIPTEYFRMSLVNAAKFRQDPRSPRKSAMDLFKAAIIPLQELCPLSSSEWDYLDRRRVQVQRNGVTRCRPAINNGWEVDVILGITLPEYVPPDTLNEVAQMAGKLIGVGDFRPTFGRYQVVSFKLQE